MIDIYIYNNIIFCSILKANPAPAEEASKDDDWNKEGHHLS